MIILENNKIKKNDTSINYNLVNKYFFLLKEKTKYKLVHNSFNPIKKSPCNSFIIKLQNRLNKYELDDNFNNFKLI